jgi:hypothetical protein
MIAEPETGSVDDDRLAPQRQTQSPEEALEAIRIAALLRDRFGTQH